MNTRIRMLGPVSATVLWAALSVLPSGLSAVPGRAQEHRVQGEGPREAGIQRQGAVLEKGAVVDGVEAAEGEAEMEKVRFGFETGDLDGFRVVEGGFDLLVCDRERFHNHPDTPYNKEGAFYLTTLERKDYRGDDRMTGIIESPVFVMAGPAVSFLVGGGCHGDTYVALCTLDDREAATARGKNREHMERVTWNLPDLVGEKVFLRITDLNTGPWGHITFDDLVAEGRIDPEATEENFARAALRKAVREYLARRERADLEALRAAVEDLGRGFPSEYPRGSEFLARLDEIEERLAKIDAALASGMAAAPGPGAAADGPDAAVPADKDAAPAEDVDIAAAVEEGAEALAAFSGLCREALIANPLVQGRPILFVVRRQYLRDHHNTATLFQTGEINTGSFRGGGALKVLDLAKGGEVRTLLEVPEGVARDPEVHFDGRKIIFSMRRNIQDDYHLYEIGTDGTGLRQLTSAPGVSDIDPLYLPDGTIVFSSTREPKYCMCNRHIMANLHRMEGDGANIRQVGKSTLFEGHGTLMPDGRVLYDRWEYVDRNFGDAQGLWTVNPDGTAHALWWGNNTSAPGGVIDGRPVPGTQKVACILGSCHDRPWGAMAVIDRRLGMDGREPVVRTWPADAVELIGKGDWDTFMRVDPKYEDPWPLSGNYFLCSRMTGKGEEMGIYLADVFGNEVLLHAEAPGCYDPMPLGPMPRPPVVPARRDVAGETGRFYVVDVYEGTHMEGVERGAVKRLRVVESPEKRSFNRETRWGGQGQQNPAMNWHDFNNKRILGTVPVEADGSAYFEVPAERYVYIQLLDARGMMVQSMRSGTLVQPGEHAGCVGCHERRTSAPPPPGGGVPAAVRRLPSPLQGWYGPERLFSYMDEVQPVLDRRCVRCHDFGKEAGAKLVLAGDRTNTFNASYNELWRKGYIKVVGAGPAEIQQARSWGSHASRLVEVLLAGHQDVELSEEELDRIVTWIDLNGPYYPRYGSAYPENLAGRSPLDNGQLQRLAELTGVPFFGLADHRTNRGPQVSFDRPELSPCLLKIGDQEGPAYQEALAIIRAGKAMLEKMPRADMPGFEPGPVDRMRREKYLARRRVESEIRKAMQKGEKVYDWKSGTQDHHPSRRLPCVPDFK